MRLTKIWMAPLLALVMLVAACGVAQWIKVAEEILPVVLPMVTNLVTAVGLLEGKTISATDVSTINTTANEVSADLNLVGQLVTQYQSSPSTTTLQQISAALGEVQNNLNGLLPALHISDPATTEKITAVVTLLNSEVSSLAQILPLVSGGNAGAHPPTAALPLNASQLKAQFNAIVSQPTNSAVVNAAFGQAVLK